MTAELEERVRSYCMAASRSESWTGNFRERGSAVATTTVVIRARKKQGYDRSVIPLSHINEQADSYTLFGPDGADNSGSAACSSRVVHALHLVEILLHWHQVYN